jgi:hypothetical protein
MDPVASAFIVIIGLAVLVLLFICLRDQAQVDDDERQQLV